MAIFRSASGCGFGDFKIQNSKTNGEKMNLASFSVASANLTILARKGSRKDSKARSAANQLLCH